MRPVGVPAIFHFWLVEETCLLFGMFIILILQLLNDCTVSVSDSWNSPIAGDTSSWMNEWMNVAVAQSCPTLGPHGLYSPWNYSGQNIGVGSCSLLQGIFPIQGSNLGLPHCRRILNQLSHRGSPLSCRLEPNSTLGSMFHPHPRTVASVYVFGVSSTQLASVDVS